MENQFFVDSEHLSPEALEKKHRLETEPSSRKNHMEYLPGMEIIESDVCQQVMSQMNAFDYSIYTARDVRAALDHETCSIEDFKALLSPAAEPFLEEMAQKARMETSKHFGNTVYLFTPLYIANYCENYCVYAELGLDALIEDGILRDIPFIGTVFSVYITIISEYNNEKDILCRWKQDGRRGQSAWGYRPGFCK